LFQLLFQLVNNSWLLHFKLIKSDYLIFITITNQINGNILFK